MISIWAPTSFFTPANASTAWTSILYSCILYYKALMCGISFQDLSQTARGEHLEESPSRDNPRRNRRQNPTRFAFQYRWPLPFTKAAETRALRPRWQKEHLKIRGRPA